ncbi:MAG: methionyl-tRNA formyltransferase [Bacteroidetes bacterium 4572_114]|nr:MAG: methionyl-tRNA formyltransferase [Bacteroidetes bacterium 4572_114]
MEYNTQREKLAISEYGRNLQKMIDYVMTISDREKRTKYAHAIVDIMAQMNNLKDSPDFRHKLWDHLFIMSDFKLDIDSPFGMPDPETLAKKPNPLSYPHGGIRYHHYGRNIQLIIRKAVELEDGPEKDALVKLIANHLKKSYLNWNRESVNDELITKHLEVLSQGKLELAEDEQLNKTSEILARNKRKAKITQRPQSNQRGHTQGGQRAQSNQRQNQHNRRRNK